MPGDETLQKHDGSDSEGEESDEEEAIPQVEIDPSKLTPLSPEVISKQVSRTRVAHEWLCSLGKRLPLIWVGTLDMSGSPET